MKIAALLTLVILLAFLFPAFSMMPVASAEKTALLPASVLVIIYEYKPLPKDAGYHTAAMYALFAPYPLEFGKNFVCRGKTDFSRYAVDVYRQSSSEQNLFQLTVGQYNKTGFNSILSASLRNELNVSMMAASAETLLKVYVFATPKAEELRSYLSWTKKRDRVMREMECRTVENMNELNDFILTE